MNPGMGMRHVADRPRALLRILIVLRLRLEHVYVNHFDKLLGARDLLEHWTRHL